LNISVQVANLSDCRIEKNRFGSENRIQSKLFLPESQCSTTYYAGNVNNNKGTAHAQSLLPWETRPNLQSTEKISNHSMQPFHYLNDCSHGDAAVDNHLAGTTENYSNDIHSLRTPWWYPSTNISSMYHGLIRYFLA